MGVGSSWSVCSWAIHLLVLDPWYTEVLVLRVRFLKGSDQSAASRTRGLSLTIPQRRTLPSRFQCAFFGYEFKVMDCNSYTYLIH